MKPAILSRLDYINGSTNKWLWYVIRRVRFKPWLFMFYWLSDVPSYDGEMEILYIIQSINQFDFGPFAIKRCQFTDLSGKFPLAF